MLYYNKEKLKKIKINKENVYFVIDFDKTITDKTSLDSWVASAKSDIVGVEFIKELKNLNQKYSPIEIDYKIPKKEKENQMKIWYSSSMNLYEKYNVTQEKIKKSIQENNLIFRKGAKEFLTYSYKNQIPVIILSAGIGNVIKQFLEQNECIFDNMYIISNFIQFDNKGNIKKFDNNKIIHTLNKTLEGHLSENFENKINTKEYGVLIGDLVEDENMINAKKWDTTLKIGILNDIVEDKLKIYKEHFDVVLTKENATFQTVFKFVSEKIETIDKKERRAMI